MTVHKTRAPVTAEEVAMTRMRETDTSTNTNTAIGNTEAMSCFEHCLWKAFGLVRKKHGRHRRVTSYPGTPPLTHALKAHTWPCGSARQSYATESARLHYDATDAMFCIQRWHAR